MGLTSLSESRYCCFKVASTVRSQVSWWCNKATPSAALELMSEWLLDVILVSSAFFKNLSFTTRKLKVI